MLKCSPLLSLPKRQLLRVPLVRHALSVVEKEARSSTEPPVASMTNRSSSANHLFSIGIQHSVVRHQDRLHSEDQPVCVCVCLP